jgi:hypothetical protein
MVPDSDAERETPLGAFIRRQRALQELAASAQNAPVPQPTSRSAVPGRMPAASATARQAGVESVQVVTARIVSLNSSRFR